MHCTCMHSPDDGQEMPSPGYGVGVRLTARGVAVQLLVQLDPCEIVALHDANLIGHFADLFRVATVHSRGQQNDQHEYDETQHPYRFAGLPNSSQPDLWRTASSSRSRPALVVSGRIRERGGRGDTDHTYDTQLRFSARQRTVIPLKTDVSAASQASLCPTSVFPDQWNLLSHYTM